MGVRAMLELEGETPELMEASEELERRLPAPEGLLARIVAPTEDGTVHFQLWESVEARPAMPIARSMLRRWWTAKFRRGCAVAARGCLTKLYCNILPRGVAR